MPLVHRMMSWSVRLAAALALALAVVPQVAQVMPVSADGVIQETDVCDFFDRTPRPHSVVRNHDVDISVTIICNFRVGGVQVFLDDEAQDFQRTRTSSNEVTISFTAENLSRGPHVVQVIVRNNGSTTWSFSVK